MAETSGGGSLLAYPKPVTFAMIRVAFFKGIVSVTE